MGTREQPGGGLARKPPACLNARRSNFSPRFFVNLHFAGWARGDWAVCKQFRPPASHESFVGRSDSIMGKREVIKDE